MEHVYQRHFGFTQSPFNITPDPSFLYLSPGHREGLAQLQYGINARRGFIVLTGEVGTGKTTLIQTLLSQLGENTQTALLFSAISSPLDLLRYVCEEFSLVEPLHDLRDSHDYISLLNQFLLERYRNGENAALIIDEAQNLSLEVLESIRLLSNFETTKDKLLQILLVGQPELNDRLDTPQLRQLKQRVTLRHHLRSLSQNECHEYITSRLKHAGGAPGLFTPKAIEAIHHSSGGIPRLINVLCDNAMINAYALDRKEIEPLLIQEVADDLSLPGISFRQLPLRREIPHTEPRPMLQTEAPRLLPIQRIKTNRGNGFIDRPSNASQSASIVVAEKFVLSLREALIDAMGPMAHIVLTEHAKLLGASLDRFPAEKVGQLVESLCGEIFDESTRARFRQYMSEKINALQK